MGMFKTNIRLTGKHASILQKYSRDKGGDLDVPFVVDNNAGQDKTIYLFETKLNCYMVAAMAGILEGKKKSPDKDNSITATIFAEVLLKNLSTLQRIYQHMVFSENKDLNGDAVIKKAFSIVPDDKSEEEQEHLEDYVRGGLEIIDEIFCNCHSYEDVCNSILDFKERFSLLTEE